MNRSSQDWNDNNDFIFTTRKEAEAALAEADAFEYPDTKETILAMGRFGDGDWEPCNADEATGWLVTTEDGEWCVSNTAPFGWICVA